MLKYPKETISLTYIGTMKYCVCIILYGTVRTYMGSPSSDTQHNVHLT